jgi:hypothetical protein
LLRRRRRTGANPDAVNDKIGIGPPD